MNNEYVKTFANIYIIYYFQKEKKNDWAKIAQNGKKMESGEFDWWQSPFPWKFKLWYSNTEWTKRRNMNISYYILKYVIYIYMANEKWLTVKRKLIKKGEKRREKK